MAMRLVPALLALTVAGQDSADDFNVTEALLMPMRLLMPDDPEAVYESIMANSPKAKEGQVRVAIVGDSWNWVEGLGSEFGMSFFDHVMKRNHNCNMHVTGMAVGGTMTTDWSHGKYANTLKKAAKDHDYIYMTLMGNDALAVLPSCARRGKSAQGCGDELIERCAKNMQTIADIVHKANPEARLVGLGYDTMFGGVGCEAATHHIFPQCYKKDQSGNRCFNEQFLRIQETWDNLGKDNDWVDSVSIMGITQVKGGDTKASVDDDDRHVDMDKMGPAKYWPAWEKCFHPGIFGGANSAGQILMEEFYRVYWSKQACCPTEPSVVVV